MRLIDSKMEQATKVNQPAPILRRNVSLDLLRVGAALAVVCVHVAGRVVMSYDPTQPFNWWGANLIGAAVHWCVPIFIMVSGVVLLPHSEASTSFYKRRLARLGLPVIGATVGFLAYETRFSFTPQRLFDMVLLGKTHLWYLYMIVGLYAATPLVRTFVAKAPRPQILGAIILVFFTAIGYTLITDIVQHRSGFSIFEWPFYLGYFIGGYYIATASQARVRRVAYFGGACACVLAVAVVNRILTPFLGATDASTISYGYLNPLVILMSLLLFRACYANSAPDRLANSKGVRLVVSLAPYTLGIYIVHPLGINLCSKLLHSLSGPLPALLEVLVLIPLVFGISLLGVYIATLIPGVRRFFC